jgi:hypothetical protein
LLLSPLNKGTHHHNYRFVSFLYMLSITSLNFLCIYQQSHSSLLLVINITLLNILQGLRISSQQFILTIYIYFLILFSFFNYIFFIINLMTNLLKFISKKKFNQKEPIYKTRRNLTANHTFRWKSTFWSINFAFFYLFIILIIFVIIVLI